MRRVLLVCAVLVACSGAYADSVNLNDFFVGPTVTVSPDGSTAFFAESPSFMLALLSNDPLLGDPEVILASPGMFLEFDYSFTEGLGNDDEFGAYIIDPANGDSLGAPYEFYLDNSGSGTVRFDLSVLAGFSNLGFQFQLASNPGDIGTDSTLMISNMRMTPSAVPEPASLFLLGTALVGLGIRNRIKRR